MMEEERREPLLEVCDVSFGYQQKTLLYALGLSVGRGEMVGLLGPNGSGKTTLLRLLSGGLQPQQGRILLQGRDLRAWGRRGVARRIAVVPQELHMPFAFTVEHMVSLGRTPFVRPFLGSRNQQDQEVVQSAMRSADIAPLAGRVFNELSGGERQRVTIAMALAQQPLLLLLDEPTSHLDIKYQIETLELTQKLNREQGVTIIAAMHDLNLAARYFPRLLLFQRGIVADAGPAEVLEPDLLSRVYGIDVQVGILRGAEHLSVLPPDEKSKEHRDALQPQVHVIAGGGSGALIMRALADLRIPFAVGALNIGDSDHTLALRLAAEVITEQPYAPIAPETLARVQDSLAHVKVLLLCPTPIGPGNLPLLQEAVRFSAAGRPVIFLAPPGVETVCAPTQPVQTDDGALQRSGMAARDYTGGEATRLVTQLLRQGAGVAASVSEALDMVREQLSQMDRTPPRL
jgi:iron complex transport system ATP-binding protein